MAKRRNKFPSVGKAKEILKDKTIRGKSLTEKQEGFFGLIAGGGTPRKVTRPKNPSPPFPNEQGEFDAAGKVGVSERSTLE